MEVRRLHGCPLLNHEVVGMDIHLIYSTGPHFASYSSDEFLRRKTLFRSMRLPLRGRLERRMLEWADPLHLIKRIEMIGRCRRQR